MKHTIRVMQKAGCSMALLRRLFVHLGYLDDSDTRQKAKKLQVMCGVLVEDKQFKFLEISMDLARKDLIPPEKIDQFTEFHACELYGGYGAFDGIEQEKRFQAISRLLGFLQTADLSVLYGAVDIAKSKKEIYGSADPLDISFRICIQEVYEWVKRRLTTYDPQGSEEDQQKALQDWLEAMVILIVDECDPKKKNMLQNSFRGLRHPLFSSTRSAADRLPHLHDDIYFGDSRYSVGIQLADLCSYFIARHLEGDEEIKGFYEMIEPHIVYGQLYPDQATFSKPQPALNLGSLSGGHFLGD